jgi:molybdopterin converting factor subunit 1
MITVQARYFAAFREHVGMETELWTLEPCSAEELFGQVAEKYALLDSAARCKVAINEELADWSTRLQEGDTVLFFPPVAGG